MKRLAMVLACVAGSAAVLAGCSGSPPLRGALPQISLPGGTLKTIEVFVDNGDSHVILDHVRRAIESELGTHACQFLDHRQSYRLAKTLFEGAPASGAIMQILSPSDAPELFKCWSMRETFGSRAERRLEQLPGVLTVATAPTPAPQ